MVHACSRLCLSRRRSVLVCAVTGSYASRVAGWAAGGAAGVVHGFATPRTSFVGRAADVQQVADLLGEFALVTVTGPGGVGKTRLAGEVARAVAPRFADGVWLAELAPVTSPELVAGAVADALGLRLAAGVSLADMLGRRQLLLVLDNCEHVLDAVASVCEAILIGADDVRMLVTSREPFFVPGESRYRLEPLPVPVPGAPQDAASADRVAASVELFADRARLSDRGFALDDVTAPLVARIAARLEGIPLAIELAAARVEALGLGQLAGRLDDPLTLVTAHVRRATAARQASLTATADWSYRLLDATEQRVFRALSVFPGPFTLEATEAVAGPQAALTVPRLVDCSLVVPPRPGGDGRDRYRMLETLRAFGHERLVAAGEHGPVATAFVEHATALAEQVAAGLQSIVTEPASSTWLEAEYGTLHHALVWAIEHSLELAPRLGLALAPWWWNRGRRTEGHDLLAAAARGLPVGTEEWGEAQYWLGAFTQSMTTALPHIDAAIDALATRPPVPALARALGCRAVFLHNLDRNAESEAAGQEALQLGVELGDGFAVAQALMTLGTVAVSWQDTDTAVAWLRRAEQLDPLTVPGWLARECGSRLAYALRFAGRLAEAREKCLAVLGSARQVGAFSDEGLCLCILADVEVQEGQLAAARRQLSEALGIYSRTGLVILLGNALRVGVNLVIGEQRWREFVTLRAAWEAVIWRYADLRFSRNEELEAAAATASTVLSAAEIRAAQERGAAMTANAAAGYALEVLADPPARSDDEPALSSRERELVVLVAQGRTDAQIASQLFISVSTVRSHLDRIRDKTGCRRRADLTRLALQAGLL
jgi:predicted ATPase/DNA-binding CsgD family transcriptional regulator